MWIFSSRISPLDFYYNLISYKTPMFLSYKYIQLLSMPYKGYICKNKFDLLNVKVKSTNIFLIF